MHWVKGLDKSFEGSVACFITTMVGWMCIAMVRPIPVTQLMLSTIAAAVFEASSSQNDNLFLPIYYLTMIKLL